MRNVWRPQGTFLEVVIAITIIIILIGTFLFYMNTVTRVAKEVKLQYELKSIRFRVTLFKALRGKNPGDLRMLMDAPRDELAVHTEETAGDLSLMVVRDQEGYPVDPFGKRYGYNARTGGVLCQSSGYEAW